MKVAELIVRTIVVSLVLLGSTALESDQKKHHKHKAAQRDCVLGEDFTDMDFETVEKGYYSGIDDTVTETMLTKERFCQFWAEHKSNEVPVPDCPTVDFDEEMVIAVFRGMKSSGGYSVEVTAVKEHETQIVVRAETTDPPADAMVSMALTQPFHIVRVKKSSKTVIFDVGAHPTVCSAEEGI